MSTITVTGYLSNDPELRYTPSGKPVASFGLGEKRRKPKGQQGEDEWTNYRCEAWNQLAENIAASVSKGDRVIVVGHFETQRYETQQGEKRSSLVLVVDDMGPEIRFNICEIERNPRKDEG